MNLKQAQMIVDIAEHIKGVKVCSVDSAIKFNNEPVCFFGEGYLAGIITEDERWKYAYNVEDSGLNVSKGSFKDLIECRHIKHNGEVTGQQYYAAAKKFLDVNGYEGL